MALIETMANPAVEGLIENYKKQINKNRLEGEIFKWKLVTQFNGRPDTNAKDFYNEIKSIDFSNLIYPVAISVTRHVAKERPEEYRSCFKVLFDEQKPLADRIKFFGEETMRIYRELVPEENFSHHQDERTMATFLTYHNPDKYTFYKDSFYKKYCKLLGIEAKRKGEKYIHYLQLVDDLINEYINEDRELIDMVNDIIPGNYFRDENHKILAQDILFSQLDKRVEEIDVENFSVYKISMGDFSEKEMEQCLSERKIVVNERTKSKGQSSEKQGEVFERMKVGDYFYLTHGNGYNRVKLFGRISGSAAPSLLNDYGDDGWLERPYELVANAVNKNAYSGTSKWWTPNNNSTCIKIKNSEIDDANKLLFEPYFNVRLLANGNDAISEYENSTGSLVERSNMNTLLNQILFGPPGTGKTYNSISRAIEIINPEFNLSQSREKVKEEFHRLINERQIAFTTFHQSMSYEDFIEGIKPNFNSEDNEALQYVIQAGIFKKLCAYASYFCYLKSKQATPQTSAFSFDELYDGFVEYVKEKIEKGDTPIFTTLNERKVTIKKINRNNSLIASAKESKAKDVAPLTKENIQKLYDKFKSISEIKELKQVQEAVQVTPRLTEFYAVFSGLKDFEKTFKPEETSEDDSISTGILEDSAILTKFSAGVFKDAVIKFGKTSKPAVLIIDEINRGNVSQIFGELITLIEDDKRLGMEESLEAILPYSKERFGVPPNLYIVGTMNTADRSVEALDAALRRRFSFREMHPIPELIATTGKLKATKGVIENIELPLVLSTINKRIEKLLDKDHQIGHSYFMSVSNLVELKHAFQYKIIPLLQEYFFGDFGKIGLVLGKGFLKAEEASKENIFADVDDYDASEFSERVIYKLEDLGTKSDEDFKLALNLLLKK